jgi:Protein of unknown function (DUF1185).
LIEYGEYLGDYLGAIAVKTLEPDPILCYGKGAIIGLDGELEHGAAILHPKFGNPVRNNVGGGKALIPNTKKVSPVGASLDVPLHYKDAACVRSHSDEMEVRIPDAPKSDEIVISLVLTSGGRPHARIGGLKISEVKGEDGLR